MSESVVLKATGIHRIFSETGARLAVLQGVDLEVAAGETLAIIGTSGSGKSTLLNILGGLDRPDQGTVHVRGQCFRDLSDKALGKVRNQQLGFIYQFHHLLPEFSALENVAMPLLIGGAKGAKARALAKEMLASVGLAARCTHKPAALSGGERQRVAIARALVTQPAVVLADEPTGNLDERTAAQVQDLMFQLNSEHGVALLVVTHDASFARRCTRRLELQDGRLHLLDNHTEEPVNPAPLP